MVNPGVAVRDRIKQEIMYDLGYPVIRVEIIEPWLDSAIDRAIREFSRWTPQSETWESFSTTTGVNKYQVPDDYVAIREVIYRPYALNLFFYDMFPGWSAWSNWFYSYVNLTDFTIADMYLGMSERTFGLQGTWEFTPPFLYLYPVPQVPNPVFIKVQKIATESVIREEDWIRRYSLATIKMRLGRVRSKFQSLPGPRGELSLDGSTLVTEGLEEIKELTTELKLQYEEPFGFYTG